MVRGLAPKLILSLTAIVLVVEGVFGFVNLRIQERQLLDEEILRADQLSTTIARATWEAMLFDHRESAYRVMRTIGGQEGVSRVRLFNKQGRVTFSTGSDANTEIDKTAEACDLCHAAGEPLVRVQAPSRARFYDGAAEGRLLGFVTPIYNEPACWTAECHEHPESQTVLGVLDLSLPLERVDREVAGIRTRTFLVGAVSVLLIGSFLVFFIRRFVGRPVKQLIRAAQTVGSMDLDRPVEIDARGELGELGHSFESMRRELKKAREEIEGFTRTLEERVKERSEQLEAAQDKLLRNERLASLGRLAASVAHEVNNPISGVLNFGMLMRRLLTEEGVPPDRLEDFRDYLEQIVSEAGRAGRIVSDLLAFSRRSASDADSADLNEVVGRTLKLLDHKLEAAGAAVSSDLAPDLPPVQCDPSRLQQVLTNLVLNAAEALGGEGNIRVVTEPAEEGDVVLLVVTDDGEGIPPKHLPRIFDPFFTSRPDGQGIGLGLAVVYGIVESYGGAIDVQSAPGEGATFTVLLQVAAHAPGDGEE